MNELQIFNNPEFGEIRTLTEGDTTLFCGSDVAKALGYAKPHNALERHCRYALKRGIPHPQSPDKQIEMTFIPEGDVYRLVASSQLEGAEKFESWIFDEVLPSIRKHGAYMTSVTIDKMIESPEFGIQLLTALKEERDRNAALMAENEAQKQTIADFQPIKHYVDTILSSTDDMTTTQIAADYELSAKKLNSILYEEGVQHKVSGQWILYREHMGQGYTTSRTAQFTHKNGESGTNIYTTWTQKGRLMIHNILTKRGIQAVMDRNNEEEDD